MNINFAGKLYLSDASLSREVIRRELASARPRRWWYVVLPISKGPDLLEVVSLRELVKPLHRDCDITIIGAAKGYRRSLRLVEQMIGDLYAADKDMNVHDFFDF